MLRSLGRQLHRATCVVSLMTCVLGVVGTNVCFADVEVDTVRRQLAEAGQAINDRQTERAIGLLSKVIDRSPNEADAYYLRGREQLRFGRFEASVKDFNRYLELKPERKPSVWERGIACYYAGQFAEGAEQFAAYQDFDGNDVENAVWHVLCRSRLDGFDRAKQSIMNVKNDGRVPMMKVYDLFRGAATPQSVLSAAQATAAGGDQKLAKFYAHLYLGLYYEARNEPESALRELKRAANDGMIDNYMWDVARIHVQKLTSSTGR